MSPSRLVGPLADHQVLDLRLDAAGRRAQRPDGEAGDPERGPDVVGHRGGGQQQVAVPVRSSEGHRDPGDPGARPADEALGGQGHRDVGAVQDSLRPPRRGTPDRYAARRRQPRATRVASCCRATSSRPEETERAWWMTSSTARSGPIWARATASASSAAFSCRARYSASIRYGLGGHGVGTTVATHDVVTRSNGPAWPRGGPPQRRARWGRGR